MRFHKIEHQQQASKARQEHSPARPPRARPEVEAWTLEDEKAALPKTWRPLARLIHAARRGQTTDEARGEFWTRLRPRLEQAILREEAVRAYLRSTRRRRWTARLATAALLALLVAAWLDARSQAQRLAGRVANLEREVQVLRGGL